LGLFLNLLLVHLILNATRTRIGSYKYLQIIFVLNDIAYSSYSFAMQGKMITKGHTFTLFLTSRYGNNLHLVCIDASLFSLILVIVSFNFLYRYWAVVCPDRIQLFSTGWFSLFLVLIAFAEFAAWYCNSFFMYAASDEARADLVPEFAHKYGLDARTRAMIMGDYWRDGHYNAHPLIGLAVFCGILSAGFAFMMFCSVSILRHLSQGGESISAKTRKLQYSLFRILTVQTLIPLLFVHFDAGQVHILPSFGIDSSVLDWCSMIVSFFPPLDAIAVILLMRDYRETITSLFVCMFWNPGANHCVSSIFVSRATTIILNSERNK
ncbi:hypothetical protein PRIPAC_96238, partial [Pristionchus pacificus]|uniref:G protein-coupled receptor n=1 Tax=Pristionchus pacificus TaxID=54126 RepID=A0A2A6B3F2_PRIPA